MELLSVAKLALYGIFLNYYCYHIFTGSLLPYGTALFFCVALGCVGLSILRDRKVRVGYEVKCWLAYIALSLLTMVFALDMGEAFDSIIKYVQRLIIIILIVYICEKENSIQFPLRLLAVNAVACAIAVLFTIDDIQLKLDISTGAAVSQNDVGALMAFGCFAVLFAFGKRNSTSFLTTAFKFASVIAMVTVIFLAGSRKSIIAVGITLVLLLLLNGKEYLKNSSAKKALIITVLGVAAFIFISKYLAPYAEETSLYTRTFGRGVERTASSDDVRIELYIQAFREFMRHPLVGLGFNNYVVEYGTYTHSTYAEPLACSGVIGLLYLAPYVRILKKQIRLVRLTREDRMENKKQKELFAFYIAFLFIGIGIPFIYKDDPCIILAMFIASQHITCQRLGGRNENA
ncbi:MAG: O-antigen ligase family protein [Ruminococcaceae bacterium]|nr:O-antigen ligase family protein [Oscillospiraceae bacterium]